MFRVIYKIPRFCNPRGQTVRLRVGFYFSVETCRRKELLKRNRDGSELQEQRRLQDESTELQAERFRDRCEIRPRVENSRSE